MFFYVAKIRTFFEIAIADPQNMDNFFAKLKKRIRKYEVFVSIWDKTIEKREKS